MKAVPFLPLLLSLSVGIGLDQWSKAWASRSLATEEHPLPVPIEADGETAAQRIEATFPDAVDALRRLEAEGRRAVMRLGEWKLTPETPVFGDVPAATPRPRLGRSVPDRILSLWVFEGESLSSPPRRLPAIGQLEVDFDAFADRPLVDYLTARLPAYSTERVARLARDWAFAVDYTAVGLDTPLARGELVLVMWRAVTVIDGLVQLRYAENPGAGWGILGEASAGFRRTFFQIFTVMALALLLYLYWRGTWLGRAASEHETPTRLVWLRWAIALVMAGAIGNFIDRFRFNHVIDFVDVYVGDLHFPTFNVADVFISVGSLLLIAITLRSARAPASAPPSVPNSAPTAGGADAPPVFGAETASRGGDERSHEG